MAAKHLSLLSFIFLCAPLYGEMKHVTGKNMDPSDATAIEQNFRELKNDDSNSVHKTSTETVNGFKTFANGISVTGGISGTPNGYVVIIDSKAAGTDGGTFTSGAWRTRTLNTVLLDTNGDASLSSNQVTLAAGTYEFFASAPARTVNKHILRLQNVTAGTTLFEGTTVNDSAANALEAVIFGKFTIAAGQALELQHQCQTTVATSGFGGNTNVTFTVPYEVYARISFKRIN